MSSGETPFNPLDKTNLGLTVARAILVRPPVPLPIATPFSGAGIYAIYYVGSEYPAYKAVADKNVGGRFDWPIYVGKAIPAGGRKGVRKSAVKVKAVDALTAGPLFKRIAEHTESIEQAPNLRIASFFCRYLAVDDIWIPLGESLLIDRLRPIWNLVIDGFGNHDPGGGRRNQMKSSWDVLHPGRSWATKQKDNSKPVKQILDNLAAFMAGLPAQIVDDPEAGDRPVNADDGSENKGDASNC
jgi:Eco29kI restriction endonuclease